MSWQVIDWTGGGLMALCALAGIVTFAFAEGWQRKGFWLLAGVGFAFLTVDELWSLHERVGWWLKTNGAPLIPGVNHHDDLILMAYALAGLALCALFWRELAKPGLRVPFALGFLALGVAVSIDALAPLEGAWPKAEELIETAGAAFFLIGFARRASWTLADVGYAWRWLPAREPAAETAGP